MTQPESDPADYRWPDLWSRRQALGVSGAQMAAHLGIKQPNYSNMETGRRRVPPGIMHTITHIEQAMTAVIEQCRSVAPDRDGVIMLTTYDDGDLPADCPVPLAAIHRTAVGRAAAELEMAGNIVRIAVLRRVRPRS